MWRLRLFAFGEASARHLLSRDVSLDVDGGVGGLSVGTGGFRAHWGGSRVGCTRCLGFFVVSEGGVHLAESYASYEVENSSQGKSAATSIRRVPACGALVM